MVIYSFPDCFHRRGSHHHRRNINPATSAAAKLPTTCPNIVDSTSCAPETRALASATAPTRIWREASDLNRGRSSNGRIKRCCTAGALRSTKPTTARTNVARKTHFSALAIALKPGVNGTVIRKAESSCAVGNRTRSSPSMSVKSPSSESSSGSLPNPSGFDISVLVSWPSFTIVRRQIRLALCMAFCLSTNVLCRRRKGVHLIRQTTGNRLHL